LLPASQPFRNALPANVLRQLNRLEVDVSHSVRIPPRLTDAIPQPQAVRERLVEALREVSVLRQLLRVAEKAERLRLDRAPLEQGVNRG
jgi:hypothetical protein